MLTYSQRACGVGRRRSRDWDGYPVGEGPVGAIEMEKLFSRLTSAIRLAVSGLPVCPEVFDRVVRAVMSLDRAHGKTLFSS